MASPQDFIDEFAQKNRWAAGKNWESVCIKSINAFTITVIVLIAMPVQFIQYHPSIEFAFRMLVYAFAVVSIAYLFSQALPIMFRSASKETAAIDDQQKSLRPKIMLLIVPIVKVVIFVVLFAVAPVMLSETSWNPITWKWNPLGWNPLNWFTLEQVVVWVVAWLTVKFDIVILQWVGYRFARLTDEISSDKIS